MLDHADLALVAAVTRSGSPSRAARELRTHVATVYRRLRALEASLGRALFERIGGRYAPTQTALEIVEAAEIIAQQLGTLERKLASGDGRLSGALSITTTDSLFPLVARAVGEFTAQFPAVQLILRVSNGMADMAQREADVAIRPTSSPPETLVGRKVADFGYAVYARAEARAAGWIGFDEELAGIPAARWLRENSETPWPIAVNSMWSAGEACAAGLGRAVLPDYVARHFPIENVTSPIASLASAVWILFHADQRLNPRARHFVRLVAPRLRLLLADGSAG